MIVEIFCSASENEIDKVEKWLIPSLLLQKNIRKINLTIINYKGKGTVYKGISTIGIVSIQEVSGKRQLGFGEAHNLAFDKIKPKDYFLIINPDVYLDENSLERAISTIKKEEKIAIVEARQLPFEHPKEFDIKTGETPWASGSFMLVRSSFFEKVGGFDPNFWMYCEDVDLSWRAWLNGYKVIHNPAIVFYHFTGNYFGYDETRYYLEHFWSARNFLYLANKYWGESGERNALKLFEKTEYPSNFKSEVEKSYKLLKKSKQSVLTTQEYEKIKLQKSRIKILGFNRYHKFKEI